MAELTAVIVGAGFSGLAAGIQLRQAGIHSFVILEKARRRRRDLARQHVSRRRVRHPLAPLLVLVRAEPRVVARLRWPGRDPRVPRALRRPLRPAAAPAVRHPRGRGDVRRGERDLDGPARARGAARRARADPRQRRAPPARDPRAPRARLVRGHRVPLGALGSRPRPDGQAGRGDRDRRERDPVRAADRGAGRTAPRVPADAAVDRRRSPIARSASASAGCSRTSPAPTGSVAPACTGGSRAACSAFAFASRVNQLAERMARAHLARSVPDPALRARLTPDYRLGCKRVLISND